MRSLVEFSRLALIKLATLSILISPSTNVYSNLEINFAKNYDEIYPAVDILNGTPPLTQAQCQARPFSIWIEVDWQKSVNSARSTDRQTSFECVQYFPSDTALKSKSALFFYSGDIALDRGEFDETNNKNYTNNSFKLQIKNSNSISSKYGAEFVHIARPGMYGSSGNTTRERHSLKEAAFISIATTAVKNALGYQRINLLGQSGGGGLVASLITSGRTDIDCAVIASGSSSLKTRLATSKSTAKVKYGRDTTGLSYDEIYDSIDYVDGISLDPRLTIVMLADPEDEAVSYVSQREFYEKLRTRGQQATWIDSKGTGSQHHVLVTQGLKAAVDCMASKDSS